METTQSSFAKDTVSRDSSVMQRAPRMSSRTLTILLALMCTVPGITIFTLWIIMPTVKEGELKVAVGRLNVPDIDYYLQPIEDRADVSGARISIQNNSDSSWSLITIRVNHHYNVKDLCICDAGCPSGECVHGNNPMMPGEKRTYLLNRFVGRTSARFDLRQIPLRQVRVFAKQDEQGNRASFDVHYPEMILKR